MNACSAHEQMSYRGFLAELLIAECDDRARRRSERCIRAEGFQRDRSLRGFDFDANNNVDRRCCTPRPNVTGSIAAYLYA